jgi:cell division protein FtsW
MRPQTARRRLPLPTYGLNLGRKHRPDYWLLILCVTLLAIGLIVVYAISPALSAAQHVGNSYYIGKQLLAIALSAVAFLITAKVPLNWWRQAYKPLLMAAAVGVAAVAIAGVQSDLGSTGVIVVMIVTMAYVAGMPLKRILTIGAIIGAILVLAISSTPYRRERLASFLHPESNCQTSGYQACQALIAVGSGGMIGLGLGSSVQAYGYLPEAANDSIFAIYAEKFGFIGSVILLGVFAAFFARLRYIIERTSDDFSRLLVVGALAWLSTQTLINIGAMIGLLPLKGITLPFISYGGTSVVFIAAAVGLVFQVSQYTSYSVPRVSSEGGEGRRSFQPDRARRATYS